MDEAFLVLFAGLYLATVVFAVVTFGLSLKRSRHARFAAKIGGVLALGVLALGAIGLCSGLALTASAVAAPGLTEADRSRMWSNGLAEALYNGALAAIVGVPAYWVARRALRSST